MLKSSRVDAVIIGGGIAGISCALELSEIERTYMLLESRDLMGGQLHLVHNAIGNLAAGFFDNGQDLAQELATMISRRDIPHRLRCQMSQVNLREKRVTTATEEFFGTAIVLATGYRKRQINLPGQERFQAQISYHHHDFLEQIAGRNIAVIGGGDNAVLDALKLAGQAKQVYLLQRSGNFRARADLVHALYNHPHIRVFLNTQVEHLDGNGVLEHLTVRNNRSQETATLPVSGIVIKVGDIPNTELFQGQVDMDVSGHILIDSQCRTSCPNVFAVGDITANGYPRLATAIGQGAMAAYGVRQAIESQLPANNTAL